MELTTRLFGKINVDESKIIVFENGLPGFPDNKKFMIINDAESPDNVFSWLQSIEDGMLSFIILDTLRVLKDYNPLVEAEALEPLGEFNIEDLLIYNIAAVPGDINKMTINLKAPVIINPKIQKGKQVIVNNEEYPIRYNIINDIKSGR